MAEITVAESAGFCFGVDRAVKLCYQALEEHHNIATLVRQCVSLHNDTWSTVSLAH